HRQAEIVGAELNGRSISSAAGHTEIFLRFSHVVPSSCVNERLPVREGEVSMAVATETLLGRPVWYELMTTDMKAAEAFYRDGVGWKTAPFEGVDQPYTSFKRGGDVSSAGVMAKPPEVKAPPFWAMYIGAPHFEETAAKITKLGGTAHTEV